MQNYIDMIFAIGIVWKEIMYCNKKINTINYFTKKLQKNIRISRFHSLKIYKRKIAFTLAEVLITLLIIGVVSSLTIPGIINSTNKAEYVTKLKKEQVTFMQAFKYITMDSGGSILNNPNFNSSTGDEATSANAMNELASRMNVIKNCGNGTGCWYASPIKWLGGTERWPNSDSTFNDDYGKAILADGTMILVDIWEYNCKGNAGSAEPGSPLYQSVCGDIDIDVNGEAGPNQYGRDIFVFIITKNGIYPHGIFNNDYSCEIDSAEVSTSYGCAGKVLTEGAMNY